MAFCTGLPATRTWPLVGAMNPAMMLSSVLLPQPLGPTMETNSPLPTVALISSIAQISRSLVRYTCPTASISTIARARGSSHAARLAHEAHVDRFFVGHGLHLFIAELPAVAHDARQALEGRLFEHIAVVPEAVLVDGHRPQRRLPGEVAEVIAVDELDDRLGGIALHPVGALDHGV